MKYEELKRLNEVDKYLEKYQLKVGFKKEYTKNFEIHLYREGEVVWRAREELKYIYYLVEGRVLIKRDSKKGKEIYLDSGEPMKVLGDMEYVSKSKIFCDVRALTDSKFLAFPVNLIEKNGKDNFEFYRLLSKSLGRKLKVLSENYSNNLFYTVKERVATFFYDKFKDRDEVVFLCEDHSASFGITERHLRRILKALINEGVLEKKENKIRLKDIKKLEKHIILGEF